MRTSKANETFIQRVLIVAMTAVAVISLWLLLPLLLLVFGSVLLAFTLRTLARPLRWGGLSQGTAVILTALIVAVGFVLATVLFGAEFVTQLKALNERAGITLSRLAAFLGLRLRTSSTAKARLPASPR